MRQWYAVHTQPRAEEKACRHLERQGFSVYLPRYRKIRRHARRVESVAAPMFPRYLFVEIDVDAQRWISIRSTAGVSHLVCQGDRPAAVPQGIVESIRGREDRDGMVVLDTGPSFSKGDRLRVLNGPFAEADAIFECVSDNDRVTVLLTLLGRRVPTKLPAGSVGAA